MLLHQAWLRRKLVVQAYTHMANCYNLEAQEPFGIDCSLHLTTIAENSVAKQLPLQQMASQLEQSGAV